MKEENASKFNMKLNFTGLDYDSFLGLGFESIFIGLIGGVIFGFIAGMYPLFTSALPFLPASNFFLFIAFGIPLTGSTHYDPRLGVISSTALLLSAHFSQFIFGLAPTTQEFFILAGIWSMTQIFIIGYLPGRLIPTSESISFLFKGLAKISILYTAVEYLIWEIGQDLSFTTGQLLLAPLISLPLLLVVSGLTSFLFTNTFCPYMMIPLISGAIKGQRYCGGGNYVYKLGGPLKINKEKIKKARMKGFKLISQLPSVTVFSCPRGGIVSVYHSGEMLVRKVNSGTAQKINKHLTPIVKG